LDYNGFVLIDTLMERVGHQSDVRAKVPDSEVMLIAVAAAKYFSNHHERAVCILRESRYLSGRIDVTRFNRRLHKLADWLEFIARPLGEILSTGEVFVIDSLPVPVCRRVRARRCKKCADGRIVAIALPKREVLRLATASDLHAERHSGQFPFAPGRLSRFNADSRTRVRFAARCAPVRG
jgi:hypothetical protein